MHKSVQSNLQSRKFVYILEDLGMDIVGIFYGPLVYFTANWYILLSLGIFPPFWLYVVPRKIWHPLRVGISYAACSML
jgi:hypothetical protein